MWVQYQAEGDTNAGLAPCWEAEEGSTPERDSYLPMVTQDAG